MSRIEIDITDDVNMVTRWKPSELTIENLDVAFYFRFGNDRIKCNIVNLETNRKGRTRVQVDFGENTELFCKLYNKQAITIKVRSLISSQKHKDYILLIEIFTPCYYQWLMSSE